MDKTDIRLFSEDEVLIREGEVNTEMFKLVSGQAAMYFNYGKDNEYLIGVLAEGRCVGQIGLLTGLPSPFTCVAFSDVMALGIKKDDFADFVKDDPYNAVDIMKSLAGMVVTMSSNINQINEELMSELGSDISDEKANSINKRIMRYRVSGMQGSPLYSRFYNK
ncbi:MAG: cyclic nucleotide-binding domain-containing protein [Ruminiclostridium sp.]|nr:cyclic nucleotide-binding domain-containing protein [Ruminiclostridium sp.]